MASTGIQTPLTQEYPTLASLSRQEMESLLVGWHPNRSDPPWYLQQASQPSQNNASQPQPQPTAPSIPIEEEKFENFIESLPQIKQIRQEMQNLIKQSEEKASRNTTLQPDLERLRNETQMLYDRARSYEMQWPEVEQKQAESYKKFSPSTLLFSLTQSATKLHDQSESLASAFVEGLPLEVASTSNPPGLTPPESGTATPTGRDADGDTTFVRRYRTLRTTYHRRNLMADRWARGTITWRDD